MDLPGRNWRDLTRAELAAARDAGALVLVPTGAIEQHADHLPVDTDTRLATAVAERAAAQAESPVIVAPTAAIGFSPHHLSLTGTLSHRLSTYLAMLSETARTILSAGFPRVLFVNGHGGNSAPLAALCGELVTDGHPVGAVDYFAPSTAEWVPMLTGAFEGVGHACEYETALVLALADPDHAARVAAKARDLPPRLTQPWIAPGATDDPISRNGARWPAIFHADDCGYYGDPAAATAETGARMLEATVAGLARFIGEFAAVPLRVGIAPDPGTPGIDRPG
ncbi:creatininase family protein [Rhodobacterales bacterium HKCCE2091]|nr:creatininase family protein [Rhodobacterales bacterium HKCCE2091]